LSFDFFRHLNIDWKVVVNCKIFKKISFMVVALAQSFYKKLPEGTLKEAERSFVIGSFGKTFHATGWKIGYCLAPEYLMAEFRKAHQFVVYDLLV